MSEKRQKTKKWLRKLQRESWQAELLVSGIAIFGALQLPGLVTDFLDWALLHLSDKFVFFVMLIYIYLKISAFILIVTFILHFSLRALWVGLVGVNSVFPDGINLESKIQSKDFLLKAKEEFPEQISLIVKLDRLCSVLFGFAGQLSMLFLAINIDIVIVSIIYWLIDKFFGATAASFFGKFLVVAATVFSIAHFVLSSKFLRKYAFVKRWHFPFFKYMNKIGLHIFYRPVMYLTLTFQTNTNYRKLATGLIIIFFFMGIIIDGIDRSNNLDLLVSPKISKSNALRTDRIFFSDYLDARPSVSGSILTPVLKSEVLSDNFLEVFVPILGREDIYMDSLCEKSSENKGATQEERRVLRRAEYSACLQRYLGFYTRDSVRIENYDQIKYQHPHDGEQGVLVKIPTENFSLGRNVISVVKSGGTPGSVSARYNIPFWKKE